MIKKINIHFVLVLLAASLWGTAGLFVRAAESFSMPQMDIVFWRAIISALILAVTILFKDVKFFKIKLRDLWLFVCGGFFSIILFNYSYYKTMSLTSLSVAAVLLYTAPFFVMLISIILFKEKLTISKGGGLVFAFLGCCLVSGVVGSGERLSADALAFGLLTGFGYALYTIFSELLIKRGYKTRTITFYIFLFAAFGCCFFTDVPASVKFVALNPKAFLIVFLMAVFNTVLPYLFYTAGLRGVLPSVAPIIATLEPVVATVIGAVVFKEQLTIEGVTGITLVLLSVAVLNIKPVRIGANAKINPILSITGKRDDGYHFIDTVMQSVTLSDVVRVKKAKKISVFCSNKELKGKANIAYKAAEEFFEYTKINKGVFIYIKKRIPEAAGLGGGSADAAAVLIALDKFYRTNLTNDELLSIAVKIGADVPFFIKGGTLRAQGIGEILTPVQPIKEGYFLLVKQGVKPSTAQIYKELDSCDYEKPNVDEFVNALETGDTDFVCKSFVNSFEAIWHNNELKEKLMSLGADGVCLSGSGPTYFAYFRDKRKAKKAFSVLKKEKMLCFLTKPCDKAIFYE